MPSARWARCIWGGPGEAVYLKKLSVSRPDRALVRARAAQAALELALRLAQEKFPQAQSPLPGTHSTAPKRWTS